MISLVVYGHAETQGSKVARHRGGTTWLTEGDGPKAQRHRAWRDAVADEARRWRAEHPEQGLIDREVVVALRFFLPKPTSAPKRRITWPRRGDLDKQARSVLDSLTHTIITNDNLVVAAPLSKEYGDPPRVEIDIVPVPDDAAAVRLSYVFARVGCGCDNGWVTELGGCVVPCPACRPAQHTAWLSGRYSATEAAR